MQNFEYYTPTRVVFGKDAQKTTGALIREQGCKKALVHYGGKSAQSSGLLDEVLGSLQAADVQYVTLGGVVPNPRLSKVYEGIALCKAENVDFILGVGGGSVIDSCKGIAYGLANACDVWKLYTGEQAPVGAFPVGAVLSIAAAGSEMSNSSVITNEEGWLKRGCNTDYARCRFAVMNPELTFTLPWYQTACGCVDIMMHTMERYFTPEASLDLTDSIGEALVRHVMQNAKTLMTQPHDYDARAQVMWASSLSHNGLTGCGGIADWACHQLEHELSGMFDVAHGAGLSAVWGSWARYVYLCAPERFAQFAVHVLDIPEKATKSQTALAGIEALESFFTSINMPISIKELGIEVTPEQIRQMAHKCSFSGNRTIGNFQKLKEADMEQIYRLAQGK